jgi:arginase family enzyme
LSHVATESGKLRAMRTAALRARTSDRRIGTLRGAEGLARALDPSALALGEAGDVRTAGWEQDLEDSRPALAAARRFVGDALEAGEMPVLTAGHCSICMSTLPEVVAREPGVMIVWIDAHGDFNTPQTTPSGFLGGMCLAAACNRWESGWPGTVDPEIVVMTGIRDLDAGERVVLEDARVAVVEPAAAGDAVRGQARVRPPRRRRARQRRAARPVRGSGRPPADELRRLLAAIGENADVVGVEITAFEAPEDDAERERLTAMLADAIRPLLAARRS